MAKRSGNFLGIHLDKTAWLIVGGLGGVALYLMLLGGYTGIRPVDKITHTIGNTIGIEGVGKGIIPDFLTPEEKQSMFAEDGDYGDMDITVA